VERRALAGPGDPWLDGLAGLCARVLVDAPCSGSGVWRRQPDARWRLTPEALLDHCAAQVDALDAAAGLVAPGGRLVYATCSLLVEENQDQAARFLTTRPDFVALDPTPLWAATLSGPCPSCDGGVLLSPARSGTDGFFVALFERRSAT
jgi:16S rRNA (cytosine967-C5)-methyltransferase